MEVAELLEKLCHTPAVSSRERKMAEFLEGIFKEYCDEVQIDKFNNCIGFKNGYGQNKKTIMVTAHLDEIGFVVKSIDENGFVKLANIGGVDTKVLLAKEIVIHGNKDIFGVIGAKPPHLLKDDETKKAVKLDELSVDTGIKKAELEKIISLGDEATFRPQFSKLQNNKVSGNGLDNKCGLATLVFAMKELKKLTNYHDVIFVATAQEEVNLAGVITASYRFQPDAAIVVDVCHGDMADAPKDSTYPLGKGPAIGIGPNLHRKLTNKIMDFAKEENIPTQIDVEPGNTGTEAWATQVSREGIPTILISIPLKYMHTQVETAHLDDVKSSARLTARFISSLSEEMEELLCY